MREGHVYHLPLRDLSVRHPGLTPAIADSYCEAARVCLDRHHISPQIFSVKGCTRSLNAHVEWEETDERTRAAWANEDDTTEAGAYACAVAAVELSDGLIAMRRAETRTGADYYVAPVNLDSDDLEDFLRLEVSGTNNGKSSAIERRLKEKVQQAVDGDSNLPAIAAVVGFRARLIKMERVDTE